MNFNASMQRLLRLRRSLERQEEMKLSLASARLHAAQSGLQQAREESRERHDALLERLEGQGEPGAENGAPVSGAELQAAGMQRDVALEREQQIQTQVASLHAAHLDQRRVLLGRTRERKTLDTLQENHVKTQRRDQGRRDQAALDEAFLLGQSRKR